MISCLAAISVQIAFASFSDVNSDTTYSAAISYAEENGIVSGYPDGTFKPLNQINRAEFVKIIVGAALDYSSSQDPSGYDIFSSYMLNFSDIESGAWYNPYLRKAVQNEIISGYPDGTFKPDQSINFAESAKILTIAFNLPDVATDRHSDHWYDVYVWPLENKNAIPVTIDSAAKLITRAEMVEMIYRLKTNITTLPSAQGLTNAGPGDTKVGSCAIFPPDNPWNQDISAAPLDPNSANYLKFIADTGGNQFLHADFGGNGEYGIPYVVVGADQPLISLNITDYPEESDPGPYPIPIDAPVENGSDAHVIAVDEDNCMLYELYQAEYVAPYWQAASAAKFDLTSNDLRPDGWTSADAAGLPIFPGLARYDEVQPEEMNLAPINHALRVTFSETQKAYIHPATHYASDNTSSSAPPMGLRLRLKADYDLSGYSGQSLEILKALKKYGLIVADNGSNWYITGDQNTGWNDEDLNQLKEVPGSAFEVVKTGEIIK